MTASFRSTDARESFAVRYSHHADLGHRPQGTLCSHRCPTSLCSASVSTCAPSLSCAAPQAGSAKLGVDTCPIALRCATFQTPAVFLHPLRPNSDFNDASASLHLPFRYTTAAQCPLSPKAPKRVYLYLPNLVTFAVQRSMSRSCHITRRQGRLRFFRGGPVQCGRSSVSWGAFVEVTPEGRRVRVPSHAFIRGGRDCQLTAHRHHR